jgi:hypothetical protein
MDSVLSGDLMPINQCPVCASNRVIDGIYRACSASSLHTLELFNILSAFKYSVPTYSLCNDCYLVFQSPQPQQEILNEWYGQADIYRRVSFELFRQEHHTKSMSDMYSFIDITLSGGDPRNTDHWANLVFTLQSLNEKSLALPSNIIDFGCGTAGCNVSASLLGLEYFGIESSGQARSIASSLGRNCHASPKLYQCKSGGVLLYTHQSVEHITHPVECFKELFAELPAPPDYIFINVPTYEVYPSGYANINSNSALNMFNISHTTMLNHVSASNLLGLLGYRVVSHTYTRGDLLILGKYQDSFIGNFKPFVPLTHSVDSLRFNLETFLPALSRCSQNSANAEVRQ